MADSIQQVGPLSTNGGRLKIPHPKVYHPPLTASHIKAPIKQNSFTNISQKKLLLKLSSFGMSLCPNMKQFTGAVDF